MNGNPHKQKWKEALRGQGLDDILDSLTLKKAAVDTRNHSVRAYFSSGETLDPARVEGVKRRLAGLFGDGQMEVILEAQGDEEGFRRDFEACRAALTEELVADIPSMRPLIGAFKWRLGDNQLVLETDNPIALDIFKRRECAGWLAKRIHTRFGLRLQVSHRALAKEENLEARIELLNRQQEVILAATQAQAAAQQASASPERQKAPRDKEPGKRRFTRKKGEEVMLGYAIEGEPVSISGIGERSGEVVVEGRIIASEQRDTRTGKKRIVKLSVFDGTGAISLKAFVPVEKAQEHEEHIQKGCWVRARGMCAYDPYDRDLVITISDLSRGKPKIRRDDAPEKRIELHAHTKMSLLDAVTPVKELIARAAAWGHAAIAVTDHGVVQAFPDAYAEAKKRGIKLILGMEGYLVDAPQPAWGEGPQDWDQPFVVFDVETTGLHPFRGDRLTEIGAIRWEGGKVKERFSTFVNPGIPIPPEIQKLTGITDDMVAGAPAPEEAMARFHTFVGDARMAAHNAKFDMSFMVAEGRRAGLDFQNHPVLDTLALARLLFPRLKSHKLNALAKHLRIPLLRHHRAVSDAETTAALLGRLIEAAREAGAEDIPALKTAIPETVVGGRDYHVVLLAHDAQGLANLYRMVTRSHLDFFYRRPRIPRDLLDAHREGILVGSACEAGELYSAVLEGRDRGELSDIAAYYDYLEVQPLGNNAFLVREGKVEGLEALRDINRTIVSLGEALQKPVVAAGDVHFLDPGDEVFRRILFHGQKYSDADEQPPLYLRTTQEMLEEFAYFGPQKARELVIDAPRRIAERCQSLLPFPEETYHPTIPGAEDMVRNTSLEVAEQRYGTPLPPIVEARLDKELKSIIGNGFSALYVTAGRLVAKSNSDGYLVGSRGSVGSSLVATFMGITEVNPLEPHYRCPQCRYSDFQVDQGLYQCGADLPGRACPRCGTDLIREGYDIPFEVFLGFEGDKVPDIDLNFSGDYQPVAHKYTEELFGEGNVFRAGTISGLAEKTAFGYVNGYLNETGRTTTNRAEVQRLVEGLTGVKRTTGQHPGGIVVVPEEIHVELFTPLQHPADDGNRGVITTHFDFNSLHDRLVKLDILGHDDPTVIRMLEDITGVDARTIPIPHERVITLFQSPEALGITSEDIDGCPTGTLGIPEFGTEFVRQMLVETKPRTMADLLRISGLSHGTNVWNRNAQDLIADGVATLPECICTREDIMTRLIRYGLDYRLAFNIMERVRKGYGLTDEMQAEMLDCDVPEWFIGSCKKISYMFPKAHAAAYVMMALRIAWFKIFHPKAYYAAYFTVRAGDTFDIGLMGGGRERVRKHLKDFKARRKELTQREEDTLTILELVLEMYSRGIRLDPVDIHASDPSRFLITETGLLPSLRSLPGLGETAALSVAEARKDGPFRSIEDLLGRTRVNKSQLEALVALGCLEGLPESDQISMF